ncbi:MAG: uracil-DNA glycosylase [Candidatus Lokiarchaeota archaeon]|nr:uracil-DNA glycosylase [Candidatus Lokiarchaeota archaeon]
MKRKRCKWYSVCPIKYYTDQGKLEDYWVKNYCLKGNKDCIRYQKEENCEYHPDNMLPDGTIREDLH